MVQRHVLLSGLSRWHLLHDMGCWVWLLQTYDEQYMLTPGLEGKCHRLLCHRQASS